MGDMKALIVNNADNRKPGGVKQKSTDILRTSHPILSSLVIPQATTN